MQGIVPYLYGIKELLSSNLKKTESKFLKDFILQQYLCKVEYMSAQFGEFYANEMRNFGTRKAGRRDP